MLEVEVGVGPARIDCLDTDAPEDHLAHVHLAEQRHHEVLGQRRLVGEDRRHHRRPVHAEQNPPSCGSGDAAWRLE